MVDKKIKNNIRAEAKQLLSKGKSRQETYMTLKEKYKYSKEVADTVKYLPSKAAKKKYQVWNYLLLAILIILTTLMMIAVPSAAIILWYGILIYAVAAMLVKYYMWVTALSAFSMVVVLLMVLKADTIIWSNIIILVVLNIPLLVLPLWLEKKLCRPPVEKKEKYSNNEGKERIRIVYEFSD